MSGVYMRADGDAELLLAVLIHRLGGEVLITDEEVAAAEYADVQLSQETDFQANGFRLQVRGYGVGGDIVSGEVVEDGTLHSVGIVPGQEALPGLVLEIEERTA